MIEFEWHDEKPTFINFFEKHTICNFLLFMKSLLQRNYFLYFYAYYQTNLPQLNLNDMMKNLHSSNSLKNIQFVILYCSWNPQYKGTILDILSRLKIGLHTWHFNFLPHSLLELKTCYNITQLKKNTTIVLKLLYIVMCNYNTWE